MVAGQFVPVQVEFGQDVAVVAETQVAGLLDEQCPTGHPQPELFFLVRVDGEFVGLLAVALEKAGLGGADIHHAQVGGIGQQLDIVIRRRRGGGHQAVPDALGLDAGLAIVAGEETHELAECLAAAEAAQYVGLVQAGGHEIARVELAVPHGFVVGQVDTGFAGFLDAADEARRFGPAQALHCITAELLNHAKRQGDQPPAAGILGRQAHELQLDDRLVQAEAGEQRAPSAGQQPRHDSPAVRLHVRVHQFRQHLEAIGRRYAYLVLQELLVADCHAEASAFSARLS
ncbi:hypothetical protein EGJ23_01405 [Pseudomonas sp. o96-267]|nr:hypothetical protein EGJ23_01405 [Pseudomonas sp. o96-267]